MRPFDHVWGGGSATCALRMRCLAGIVVLPIVLTPFLSPPPAGEGFNGDEGLSLRLWDPHPCPLPEGEGARTGGTLCTPVGQESNDTAQLGGAVYLMPPYSVLRGPRGLSHRKWIVAPFLRRTMYPCPRPSLTTSATPNDSPTACQHACPAGGARQSSHTAISSPSHAAVLWVVSASKHSSQRKCSATVASIRPAWRLSHHVS